MNNGMNFQTPEENPENSNINNINSIDNTDNLNGLNGLDDLDDMNDIDDIDLEDIAGGGNIDNIDKNKKSKSKLSDFSISSMWKSIKGFWAGLQKRTKIFAVASASALLVAVIVITVILNQSPYIITYSALDERERSEVITFLENNKIPYKYDLMFNTIKVREKDQAKTVGALLDYGYAPVFEPEVGGALLETQDDKKDRARRNLENKLASYIGGMTGIDSATVILVVPDNTRAVVKSEVEPSTAAVQLYIRNGFDLSDESVAGIESMVMKAVPKLTKENISIINQDGIILNVEQVENDSKKYVNLAELREVYERQRKQEAYNEILNSFAVVFGSENIVANVSVFANFDNFISESKNYTGSNVDADTDKQSGITAADAVDWIIGSDVQDDTAREVPDLNTNDQNYFETFDEIEGNRYSAEYHATNEYLVNYTLEQLERNTPVIENISVSIIINREELDEDLKESLIRSVAMAAGINHIVIQGLPEDETLLETDYLRNHIEITAIRFFEPWIEPEPIPEPPDMQFRLLLFLGIAAVVLIIFITVLIVITGKKRRERREREEELARERAMLFAIESVIEPEAVSVEMASGQYAANHMSIANEDDGDIESSEEDANRDTRVDFKRQIQLFTEQNPELAAQLVKTLLKGDEMVGG